MKIIENDLAERYAAALPPPCPTRTSEQDREQDLARSISSDKQTLAGYLITGVSKSDLTIQSLVRLGQTAEAKAEYDRRQTFVKDNRENLTAIASMTGGGVNTEALRTAATKELQGAVSDVDVRTVDGQTYKLGAYFNDDRIWKNPGEHSSFSKRSVESFLNTDDDELRRSLGLFMKGATDPMNKRAGGGFDPMRIQNSDAADAVNDNWKEIKDTFGDGASQFVQYVQETHKDAGAAAPFLRSMLKLGRAHAESTSLTGAQLVDDMMGSYRTLMFSAFRGDPADTGSSARKPSTDQQLVADGTIVKMLTQLEDAGGVGFGKAVLENEKVRRGLRECLDMMAEADSDGIDLAKETGEGGTSITTAFADHLADIAKGLDSTSGFVANYRRFSGNLKRQLTGGKNFVGVPYDMTSDPQDMQKLSRMAGGQSSCPEADNIAAGAHRVIRRLMATPMSSGKTAQQSWDMMDADPDLASQRLDALTTEIAKSFRGRGAVPAAQQLADSIIRSVSRGSSLSIEDEILRAAGNKEFLRSNPLAYQSVRNWVYGNVAATERYAEKLAQLDAHWASESGGGLSDRDRKAAMSRLKSSIAEFDRIVEGKIGTGTGEALIDEALNRGIIYQEATEPMLDLAGRPMMGGPGGGKTPRLRTVVHSFDSSDLERDGQSLIGFTPRKEPGRWAVNQKRAFDTLQRLRAEQEDARKKELAEMFRKARGDDKGPVQE